MNSVCGVMDGPEWDFIRTPLPRLTHFFWRSIRPPSSLTFPAPPPNVLLCFYHYEVQLGLQALLQWAVTPFPDSFFPSAYRNQLWQSSSGLAKVSPSNMLFPTSVPRWYNPVQSAAHAFLKHFNWVLNGSRETLFRVSWDCVCSKLKRESICWWV